MDISIPLQGRSYRCDSSSDMSLLLVIMSQLKQGRCLTKTISSFGK